MMMRLSSVALLLASAPMLLLLVHGFSHAPCCTFRPVRSRCFPSELLFSTASGDDDGNLVDEVERLRTSLARLENDISKQKDSVNQQNDSVKLVEEGLRNIDSDGWFTPERAPQLAYLRDCPPNERQTQLMDVLKVEKEDLRRKEEDLRRKEEDLRRKEEDLRKEKERLDAAKEDRRKEKLAVQKEVFKFDEDCWPPHEVPIRKLYKTEPRRFVASERWLRNVTASIEERLMESDSEGGASRVPGTGLVRCSRGGKTRSLYEIWKWFKENRADVAVLFVTFNDETNVQKNEQSDPIAALCNRIAWRAHKGSKRLDFDRFQAKYQVDQGDVIAWLGSTRRLLLIDEINKLRGSRESFEFGDFLKKNFMTREGQYFVFTSHELRTSTALLKDVIDAKSISSRQMNIFRLPVAPTLREAQLALGWPTLQTHQVIYFGRIPALLVTKFLGGDPDNHQSRIDSWAKKIETKDEQNVLFSRTISSFFSGKSAEVPDVLLPLMDSTSKDQVCWIPFYLHTFAKSVGVFALDDSVCRILTLIDEKLGEFYNSKDQSGDGWEALFVVALAMRALLGRSHKIALFDPNVAPVGPLDSTFLYRIEPVSYNEPFTGVGVEKIEDPASYIAKIPDRSKPGISIYIPSTATFLTYDVFLVVWDEEGNRSFINGYQLKKGTKTALSSPCPLVTRSFLVKGKPPKNPRTNNRKISSEHFVATQDGGNRWIDVSEGDIASFFGVSGAFWTPNKWNELYASRK